MDLESKMIQFESELVKLKKERDKYKEENEELWKLRLDNQSLNEQIWVAVESINKYKKALEKIYNVESLCERDSLLHALSEINQIAEKALAPSDK